MPKKSKKAAVIKSYTFEDTNDENIKRFVDRKGDWTHYWLVKEKKFVKAVNWVLSLGYSKGPRFAAYLSRTTEEEQKTKLIRAGDEGTRTHRAISMLIAGSKITMNTKFASELTAGRQESLNDDEWENLQAFENWCAVYKPRYVAQDQAVTDGETFAGTFDALLVITVPEKDKAFAKEYWGKDVLILMDWKSSSGIWEEYKAQLAAYWYGIRHSGRWNNYVDAYPQLCFSGILRIGTRHICGYEFKVWDSVETAFNYREFDAAQVIAQAHEPKFDPEICDIKTEFFIKFDRAVVEKPKRKRKKKAVEKLAEKINRQDPIIGLDLATGEDSTVVMRGHTDKDGTLEISDVKITKGSKKKKK